jgi:NAD(P)-dependent dehydrogenase (short-subunit alcohol dehydrogenase family)
MATANGSMQGKICLITGSTSGMGKETALALAQMGATVVLVSRDRDRGEATKAEIIAKSGNQAVDLLIADLSSQTSIRQLAEDFKAKYQRLHVLVNNAGAVYTKRTLTVDGVETTFAVNHLAYFLLTNLLLDVLKASAARIVNVSSEAQSGGTINFDDLQGAKRYGGFRAYSQSKLANVLFTYELARRLQGTGVTANCLHPGSVASGFGKNNGWLFSLVFSLLRPFFLSAEAGAQTSIYLASAPEVAGVSGQYFIKKKPARSIRESYDLAVAQRLWQVSAELTGLAA